MNPLPSKSTAPNRWTVQVPRDAGTFECMGGVGGVTLYDEVEVMPVVEHTAAMADAEKAVQTMQARWSTMIEQSKQHVERARVERDRAVETRENANAVSVRVEGELRRLREAVEELFLYEPGRKGHATAMARLRAALNNTKED